jgi:alcohol dehydrogenase class IV
MDGGEGCKYCSFEQFPTGACIERMAMDLRGDWNYPTSVRFGNARIVELPETVRSAQIARPLFVTDPKLATLPMVADAMVRLESAGIAAKIFCDIRPNPVERNIADGVAAFKAGRHDGVVALGGGSALDAGKLIAFMVGQTRPLWDFEDSGEQWRRANADGIAPVVAVPTTAGTGSEVGRAAVVIDTALLAKKIIFHPLMMPKAAIWDPGLTAGMPPMIAAGTGMDAFAHCLEAYCAPRYHPLADGIAVEGIRLIKENLVRAVKNGDDLEARANMMTAAVMGATAFQKGLGAIHALSHPVNALYDTHHGLTNAVFMPYVLAFNCEAVDEKISRLSAYIGIAPSFRGFFEWVLDLRAELGIPHTLAGLGVGEENITRIAAAAPADPTAVGNPVPLDERAARSIFTHALEGKM